MLYYLITISLVVSIMLLYHLHHLTWKLWKRKYHFIPNAPSIPWRGTTPYLGDDGKSFYKAITTFARNFDHLYLLWLGPTPVIRTGQAEFIEAICRNKEALTKSSMYDPMIPWLNEGLVMSTDSKWKTRRALMNKAFHLTILKDFTEVFVAHAKHLVKTLGERHVDTGFGVDMQKLSSLSTLDVVCETLLGIEMHALQTGCKEYLGAVNNVKRLMTERMVNPLLAWDALYRLTSKGRMFYDNLNLLHKFSYDAIDMRMEKHELIKSEVQNKEKDNAVDDDEEVDTKMKNKKIFLDILLDAFEYKEIDRDGMREELDTFVLAGHDTTAAAISWTLYEIGRRPHIQEKLHNEIESLHKNGPISEQIAQLKYLDLVTRESLRHHPPAPTFGRKLEQNLEVNGMNIPKGTEIMIEVFGVHMNPRYWNNPEQFIPERFERYEVAKRHRYSFIPFSSGPRNCIGEKFAMLNLKIYLFCILSKYRVESMQELDQMDVRFDTFKYSANGIMIQFYSK